MRNSWNFNNETKLKEFKENCSNVETVRVKKTPDVSPKKKGTPSMYDQLSALFKKIKAKEVVRETHKSPEKAPISTYFDDSFDDRPVKKLVKINVNHKKEVAHASNKALPCISSNITTSSTQNSSQSRSTSKRVEKRVIGFSPVKEVKIEMPKVMQIYCNYKNEKRSL